MKIRLKQILKARFPLLDHQRHQLLHGILLRKSASRQLGSPSSAGQHSVQRSHAPIGTTVFKQE